jgi:DNA modification methylase
MLNRRYIGFEIVREYYEFAKERLEKNIYRIKEGGNTKRQLPDGTDLFDEIEATRRF